MPAISINKKGLHNYEILERFEAGIVLSGQEVKSVKGGQMHLDGAYVRVRGGEAWLVGAEIPKYRFAGPLPDYDAQRTRKLLFRKREIRYLTGKTQEKGLTLVPVSVYTSRSKIKLEIGLARGRQSHDKRDVMKERDVKRQIARALKRGM
ncbi:MAG: SsrA-binding protein SmpB [Patescibacteria group bacterium]|nr:SsrA-binding protein SmpB [Patescibacteria group bacterium]